MYFLLSSTFKFSKHCASGPCSSAASHRVDFIEIPEGKLITALTIWRLVINHGSKWRADTRGIITCTLAATATLAMVVVASWGQPYKQAARHHHNATTVVLMKWEVARGRCPFYLGNGWMCTRCLLFVGSVVDVTDIFVVGSIILHLLSNAFYTDTFFHCCFNLFIIVSINYF